MSDNCKFRRFYEIHNKAPALRDRVAQQMLGIAAHAELLQSGRSCFSCM